MKQIFYFKVTLKFLTTREHIRYIDSLELLRYMLRCIYAWRTETNTHTHTHNICSPPQSVMLPPYIDIIKLPICNTYSNAKMQLNDRRHHLSLTDKLHYDGCPFGIFEYFIRNGSVVYYNTNT